MLVHNRDRPRVTGVAREFERRTELESDPGYDGELTREALEAGPPPEV